MATERSKWPIQMPSTPSSGDRLDLLDPFGRLDLGEEHHVPVGGAERGRRRALPVAIVGYTECDSTPTFAGLALPMPSAPMSSARATMS